MIGKIKALVTGAGGFIGHHLVKQLKQRNYYVIGVDIKTPEFEKSLADTFVKVDLRDFANCDWITKAVDEVYNLAANMGGIGFIHSHKAEVMRDNVLINSNMIEAARRNLVRRYFFSSSACIYPGYLQNNANLMALAEDSAYPADPEDGYGWEKLFSERLARHYYDEYGFQTRVARFHNIYGPLGTYDGGREKSPAAICRKIAEANDGDEIEVWGDGNQTRSFCYVDDCVDGILRLMQSSHAEPINIGSDRLVSINDMIDIVASIAGKKIRKRHSLEKPQGVRGRNSDNAKIRAVLDWEPLISLEYGLEVTYQWIEAEMMKKAALKTMG